MGHGDYYPDGSTDLRWFSVAAPHPCYPLYCGVHEKEVTFPSE